MTREYRLYMYESLKNLLEKDVWLDRILVFLRSEAEKGKLVASEAVANCGAAAMMPKRASNLDALLGEESGVGGGDGEQEQVDFDRKTVKEKAMRELAAYALNWNDGVRIPMETACPLEDYWRGKRDVWPCITYMAFAIL